MCPRLSLIALILVLPLTLSVGALAQPATQPKTGDRAADQSASAPRQTDQADSSRSRGKQPPQRETRSAPPDRGDEADPREHRERGKQLERRWRLDPRYYHRESPGAKPRTLPRPQVEPRDLWQRPWDDGFGFRFRYRFGPHQHRLYDPYYDSPYYDDPFGYYPRDRYDFYDPWRDRYDRYDPFDRRGDRFYDFYDPYDSRRYGRDYDRYKYPDHRYTPRPYRRSWPRFHDDRTGRFGRGGLYRHRDYRLRDHGFRRNGLKHNRSPHHRGRFDRGHGED